MFWQDALLATPTLHKKPFGMVPSTMPVVTTLKTYKNMNRALSTTSTSCSHLPCWGPDPIPPPGYVKVDGWPPRMSQTSMSTCRCLTVPFRGPPCGGPGSATRPATVAQQSFVAKHLTGLKQWEILMRYRTREISGDFIGDESGHNTHVMMTWKFTWCRCLREAELVGCPQLRPKGLKSINRTL